MSPPFPPPQEFPRADSPLTAQKTGYLSDVKKNPSIYKLIFLKNTFYFNRGSSVESITLIFRIEVVILKLKGSLLL